MLRYDLHYNRIGLDSFGRIRKNDGVRCSDGVILHPFFIFLEGGLLYYG
jgi:hypothetical protein